MSALDQGWETWVCPRYTRWPRADHFFLDLNFCLDNQSFRSLSVLPFWLICFTGGLGHVLLGGSMELLIFSIILSTLVTEYGILYLERVAECGYLGNLNVMICSTLGHENSDLSSCFLWSKECISQWFTEEQFVYQYDKTAKHTELEISQETCWWEGRYSDSHCIQLPALSCPELNGSTYFIVKCLVTKTDLKVVRKVHKA